MIHIHESIVVELGELEVYVDVHLEEEALQKCICIKWG
jgi:hypothetical protein